MEGSGERIKRRENIYESMLRKIQWQKYWNFNCRYNCDGWCVNSSAFWENSNMEKSIFSTASDSYTLTHVFQYESET